MTVGGSITRASEQVTEFYGKGYAYSIGELTVRAHRAREMWALTILIGNWVDYPRWALDTLESCTPVCHRLSRRTVFSGGCVRHRRDL